ncbi:MAG: hypothetical protein L0Z55_12555 [Planctomycetes bacterium]|nr:hypothetical protein [Planctomycetota bacterium]
MARSLLAVATILSFLSVSLPLVAGPDVIVSELPAISNYAAIGGIDVFSVGTTSCNIGDEVLDWIATTNDHPVIGQNMFRLKDGRFEQIGMSWLKHGFTALQDPLCDIGCTPNPNGSALGVGCSDPYSSFLNGIQSGLGPRFEVNAATGFFEYPYTDPAIAGGLDRRLQVHVEDLDPDLNVGAIYFVEGQYIQPDDAAANNDDNNASWRECTIATAGTDNYTATATGSTIEQEAAIHAWQAEDPSVTIVNVDVADDGRFIAAYTVTDLGNGYWHYEYAIQNLNSDQSAGSVSFPIPAGLGVTALGFHDVDYHSGEPFAGTDWEMTAGASEILFETDTIAEDPDANALRWGTLYNFRFDANSPPADGTITIGLFKPGTADSVTFTGSVPSTDFLSAPTSVACVAEAGGVELSWVNGADYAAITVLRNGDPLAVLAGTAESYTDSTAAPGTHEYEISAETATQIAAPAPCSVTVPTTVAISYPSGVPALFSPSGQTLEVALAGANGHVLDLASPALYYDIGAGFVSTPLAEIGAGTFEAQFPLVDCEQEIHWYISAASTDGIVTTDPLFAPDTYFAAIGATSEITSSDDMEADLGWTVGATADDALSGIWTRGDPNGTDAQPEDDHSASGTFCWFTGQATAGAGNGTNDVDGGQTTLISPEFDLAEANDPSLSYWRWYSNSEGAAPNTDSFAIDITNDGVTWTNVETVGPTGLDTSGGWFFNELRVLDYVALSGSVQLRFVVSDEAAGSLVEAAIDDLVVTGYICDADCNANGVDDATDLLAGTSQDCNSNGFPDECDIAVGTSEDVDASGVPDECELPALPFVRGDCNADGSLDISDPIHGLAYLFAGKESAGCLDACDINDSGAIGIDDMIHILTAMFANGEAPAPPYPDCGDDPSADLLGCSGTGGC